MDNTEWAFPFADNNGDRVYSDSDFAKFFSAWFVNGVFINVGGGLQLVDSVAGGMRITLKSGAANINGRVYYLNTDTDLTVPVASPVQDRTDSIVVKLDITNRTMGVVYKQGDTTVTRNTSIYEMQLATIFVAKNINEMTKDMISDMRTNKSVCGLASPNDPVDVDQFVTQFKAIFDKQLTNNSNDFDAWFSNLKNQLDSNQASNLQNQINKTNDNVKLKANITDQIKIKPWSSNTQYNIGDNVFIGQLGDLSTGLLNNTILRCIKSHVSTNNFPSSDDKTWVIINSSSYSISAKIPFVYSRDAIFYRSGNSVTFTYQQVRGSGTIPKGVTTIFEKQPIWADPASILPNDTSGVVYITGLNLVSNVNSYTIILKKLGTSPSQISAYSDIPAGWDTLAYTTYMTDADEVWSSGVPQ